MLSGLGERGGSDTTTVFAACHQKWNVSVDGGGRGRMDGWINGGSDRAHQPTTPSSPPQEIRPCSSEMALRAVPTDERRASIWEEGRLGVVGREGMEEGWGGEGSDMVRGGE